MVRWAGIKPRRSYFVVRQVVPQGGEGGQRPGRLDGFQSLKVPVYVGEYLPLRAGSGRCRYWLNHQVPLGR